MMTLGELQDIIAELLQNEGIDKDYRMGVEHNGLPLDIKSVNVIVSSEHWETGTVVMTVGALEGEVDDG